MKLVKRIFFIPRWRGLIYSRLTTPKSSTKAVISRPLLFTTFCIQWESGFSVGKNARIEGEKFYQGVQFSPQIIFHENVSIQQNCHITCAERIEIGRETAIASNVTITDIEHSYEDIYVPIEKQLLKTKPVKIGADCKIYNNAVILQGTEIGDHCVVGANSVVKGLFPNYSIIVGVPARVVKIFNPKVGRWESVNPKKVL